ncbi:MAG TPA: hypothetical protein VEA59_07135 [Patescibacteria group bacterium]|nr:hypothetical protein [Patescibacteria group bacterium]
MGFFDEMPGGKGFQTQGPNKSVAMLAEMLVSERVTVLITHGGYRYAHAAPHSADLVTQPVGRVGQVVHMVDNQTRLNFGILLALPGKSKTEFRSHLLIVGGELNRCTMLVEPPNFRFFDILRTSQAISQSAVWEAGRLYELQLAGMPLLPPWMAGQWAKGMVPELITMADSLEVISQIKIWGKANVKGKNGKSGLTVTREPVPKPEELPAISERMVIGLELETGKTEEYDAPCVSYALEDYTPPTFDPAAYIQDEIKNQPKYGGLTEAGILAVKLDSARTTYREARTRVRLAACALAERGGGSMRWRRDHSFTSGNKKKKEKYTVLVPDGKGLKLVKLTWTEKDVRWAD